jgi:hypothetical protein
MPLLQTQWDGGAQRLQCFEYSKGVLITNIHGLCCLSNLVVCTLRERAHLAGHQRKRRVVKCLFDGYHGSWLPSDHGEQMTWWFMRQFIQ